MKTKTVRQYELAEILGATCPQCKGSEFDLDLTQAYSMRAGGVKPQTGYKTTYGDSWMRCTTEDCDCDLDTVADFVAWSGKFQLETRNQEDCARSFFG